MKKDIFCILVQFCLLAIYFMDPAWIDFSDFYWLLYPGLVLTIIGALVVIFGILHLNDNLTPFPTPKKNSVLISSGIYAYIRHPIYAGLLLGLFGYSFVSFSLFRLALVLLLGFIFYMKSNFEEKMLLERYEEYSDYKTRTGRFFPKLKL